ncbi:MAG TPA: putative lipid II flippase FtsW [Spirochaetia bacterium]|nr:putative lipid II flippase FtsW [Spirochaetia bacterium]
MVAEIFTVEKIGRNSADYPLAGVLFILLGVGLSMLFSASYYWAQTLVQNPFYFFKRQIIWVLAGLALSFIASRISMTFLKKLVPWILLVTVLAMLLTFIPGIGTKALGARRWFYIFGVSFQPSEVVKLATVIYLAYIFEKRKENFDNVVNSLLPPLIVVLIFTVLIYLQNDYSTAMFVLVVGASMFFIAKVPLRYFVTVVAATVPFAVLLLLSRAHRVRRIIAFIDPQIDPSGIGYQVLASQSALMNGGLWGRGIGESLRKFGGLPEAHSDFVFAIVGEELGFVGIVLIISLFLFFAYRGYRIAYYSRDTFRSLLAFGLTTCIVFQAMVNMGVVAGIVPATGITLPFFSAGGSSILVSMVMCGLLLNLSRFTGNATEEGLDG